MFEKRSDGVELYFIWRSRTARIVPNATVRAGISLRDNLCGAAVGLGLLMSFLSDTPSTFGAVTALVCAGLLIERGRYLSRLQKVPFGPTTDQVDRAYIRERNLGEGIMLMVAGVFFGGGLAWAAFTLEDMPGFLVAILALMSAGFLAMIYVGARIVAGKRRSARRGHDA